MVKKLVVEEVEVSTDFFCEGIEGKIRHGGKKLIYLNINFTGHANKNKGYREKSPPYFSFYYPFIPSDSDPADSPSGKPRPKLVDSSPLAKDLSTRLIDRIGHPHQDKRISLYATKFNQRKLTPSPTNYKIEAAYFGKRHRSIHTYGAVHQGYKPGVNRVFTHDDGRYEWYLFRNPDKDTPIDPYKLYLGHCKNFTKSPYFDEFSDMYPSCIHYGVDYDTGYELSFRGDERFVLNNDAMVDEIVRFLDEKVICEQNVISGN